MTVRPDGEAVEVGDGRHGGVVAEEMRMEAATIVFAGTTSARSSPGGEHHAVAEGST
jgi:hypothetical protein